MVLTIQELGALDVALFHLLTLICGSLHIANGAGKDGRPRLYQQLAEMDAVARGSAVKRSPVPAQKKSTALHTQ